MRCNSSHIGNQKGLKISLRRLDYLIRTEQRTPGLLMSEIIRTGVLSSKFCHLDLTFGGCRHLNRHRLFSPFWCSLELYYRIYKQVAGCAAYPSRELKDVLKYAARRPVMDAFIHQVPAEVRE
jgi:hypothetical protein